MEEEHEIEVNGTDALWGETGNYVSTAVVMSSSLDVLAPIVA
jgi:hypothetical protein